jgi:hypothetical protein
MFYRRKNRDLNVPLTRSQLQRRSAAAPLESHATMPHRKLGLDLQSSLVVCLSVMRSSDGFAQFEELESRLGALPDDFVRVREPRLRNSL